MPVSVGRRWNRDRNRSGKSRQGRTSQPPAPEDVATFEVPYVASVQRFTVALSSGQPFDKVGRTAKLLCGVCDLGAQGRIDRDPKLTSGFISTL